jgi:hypothetical protein
MGGSTNQAREFAMDAERVGDPRDRTIERLWFALERGRWSSVVIVPVDPSGTAATIARALAGVGRRLRGSPVDAIVLDSIDYAAASRASASASLARREVTPAARPMQLIVAVPSLLEEPLGTAVALAADATVLVVRAGRTRLADVRRTIDIVGRERVAGTILVR